MEGRGKPLAIRCDNGPELTSRHFLAWSVEMQIELRHIQPGKPTQNAHIESFHARLRDECLRINWFRNLFDARKKVTSWKFEYNEERPHSSLGYRTPTEFALRQESMTLSAWETLTRFRTFPQLRLRVKFITPRVRTSGADHTRAKRGIPRRPSKTAPQGDLLLDMCVHSNLSLWTTTTPRHPPETVR